MDLPQFIPLPLQANTSTAAGDIRYLPSYQEANIQYSLRLPAYRSSYIRRFHHYARYHASAEQYPMVRPPVPYCPTPWALTVPKEAEDEIEPLDLSILNLRIPRMAAALNGEREVDNCDEQINEAEDLHEDDEYAVGIHNEQANGAEQWQEGDEEPPVLVHPDVAYANREREQSQQGTFLRIDVASALEALRLN